MCTCGGVHHRSSAAAARDLYVVRCLQALARTIDLQALGVSPEAAEAFRAEESRVARSMRQLPVVATDAMAGGGTDAGGDIDFEKEPTALEKLITDRSNQVHYYIRAIQMEQLLDQDLDQVSVPEFKPGRVG